MKAEEVLRRHFQAEVPEPWPACQATGASPAVASRLPGRSALALAAAVLLGLGLWLGQTDGPAAKPQTTGPKPLLNTATADGKNIIPAKPNELKPE